MYPPRTSEKWLFPVRANEKATIQLICFSFAGGGASVFSNWQELLQPAIQIRPVQLPGRENRFSETPVNNINSLLTDLVELTRPLTEKNWAVFGHSMGALIAVELAARLCSEANCNPPEHIFVSGKVPIHLPLQKPLIGMLDNEALLVQLQIRYGIEESSEQLELTKLMLDTIRADIQLVESHQRPNPIKFSCPLTALQGISDICLTEREMQLWQQYTDAGFNLIKLPGDHFYLQASRVQIVAAINQALCL